MSKSKTALFLKSLFFAVVVFFSAASYSFALNGITNPGIDVRFGGSPCRAASGSIFADFFVFAWRALIFVGALAVLLNLVTATFHWITAGGNAGEVTKARQQMINAIIGIMLLVGSFIIVGYIGNLFGFNLLNFNVPIASNVPCTDNSGGGGPVIPGGGPVLH